jgi:hypothetical protein
MEQCLIGHETNFIHCQFSPYWSSSKAYRNVNASLCLNLPISLRCLPSVLSSGMRRPGKKQADCFASLAHYSNLKMQAVRSSETSIKLYRTTPCHIPQQSTLHIYRDMTSESRNSGARIDFHCNYSVNRFPRQRIRKQSKYCRVITMETVFSI